VGAFSHKFSISLSGKTTDRIKKKLEGCKNGTDLLYHRAKYDGDPGSRAGCRQKKCDVFVCFLSRFGMTKFVITETLWSSIIFKTIMVSLHRGRFVVVHLCSSFPIDPQNFSRGTNFYQKLPFLAIFGAVRPHFKAIAVKFGMRVRSLGSIPQAKYCKNGLRGIPLFGKLYKKYQFWRFWGLYCHIF